MKSPRCQFASVHTCPRYYQSLSLLGGAGFTKIEKSEDEKLFDFWKEHPLWPATDEQATGTFGGNEGPNTFYNFCPEVMYDAFGLFASFLSKPVDDIDRDCAARILKRDGVPRDDPRWIWSDIRGQHYTECPIYSTLSHDWPRVLGRSVPTSRSSDGSHMAPFDVFISHASEDKDDFVRPLAAALTELGLRVWYDEWTLSLGDSLRRKIDEGLSQAEFGIVVLSKNFISKSWPEAELDALFAREMQGRKVILPVWHNITVEEVTKYSPLLAGKLAAPTNQGVESVAKTVFDVVRKETR